MCLKINNDAIFIADSHFSPKNAGLVDFLDTIEDPPSQIFLMGDITQILVGEIQESIESNIALLKSIDRLDKKTQIFWLEGNHDIKLEGIKKLGLLQNTHFIPRKFQPISCTLDSKKVLLAHGDLFLNAKYKIYINILISSIALLNFINKISLGSLYKAIEKKSNQKPIKIGKCEDIKAFGVQRIKKYNQKMDILIEGHFHIGKHTMAENALYVALPCFCFDSKPINAEQILLWSNEGR